MGTVSWGTGQVAGRDAFIARWDNVGGIDNPSTPNIFNVVLVSRADINAGDFDAYFNYQSILWDNSGIVTAGLHNGNGGSPQYYAVPGSSGTLANGSGVFLDGGPLSLASSSNIGDAGVLSFSVRNGLIESVATISAVPEPATYALVLGIGIGLTVIAARKRRHA